MNKSGCMSDEDHSLINRMVTQVCEHTPEPSVFVYLRVSEDVIVNRVKSRGRSFEQFDNLNISYIAESIKAIEYWVEKHRSHASKIITVDGNQNSGDVVNEIIKRLK